MNIETVSIEAIYAALDRVKDPEIPVISIVELGVVRDVSIENGTVVVTMTPTFSGCPALDVMRRDIKQAVRDLGMEDVEVRTVLSPPWTTDWIGEEAREKLRQFGLAPPGPAAEAHSVTFFDLAECPYCGGTNTSLRNSFGPTLCRMIYFCNTCQEPFEKFKAI